MYHEVINKKKCVCVWGGDTSKKCESNTYENYNRKELDRFKIEISCQESNSRKVKLQLLFWKSNVHLREKISLESVIFLATTNFIKLFLSFTTRIVTKSSLPRGFLYFFKIKL